MAQVGDVQDIVNVQFSRWEARELFDLLGQTPEQSKSGLTSLEEGLAKVFVRNAA